MVRAVLQWRSYTSQAWVHKLMSRPSAALLQTAPTRALPATTAPRATHARVFHHTPSRRLFGTPGQLDTIAGYASAATALVVVIMLTYRHLRNFPLLDWCMVKFSSVPPLAWATKADSQTRAGVLAAIGAGFALARSRPTSLQNDALREATFEIPYDIARLNKDAPQFKITDMGHCPVFSDQTQMVLDIALEGFKPSFTHEKDTRVFLYYPNGSKKATAAFLVINTEFTVPSPQEPNEIKEPFPGTSLEIRHSLVQYAINMWINTYARWADDHPEIIRKNIEPGNLPVIFCFRNKISGSIFDQKTKIFPGPVSASLIFDLIQPEI